VEANAKTQFELMLASSIENQEFIKLTLGNYKGQENELRKIFVKIIRIKSGVKLSLTYSYKTREIVKNYSIDEGVNLINSLIGNEFMSSVLFTSKQDVQLEYDKKRNSKVSSSKPTLTDLVSVSPQEHDRKKIRHVESGNNAYLTELGVTNKEGKIVKGMESKFRQINKFIEIINGLLDSSDLISRDCISVLDMGSGKGYLTFALYDFLNNSLSKETSIVGIESRLHLVDFCNALSKLVGFKDLRFEHGNIKSYALNKVDITVALHACDTATDDAIYKGIMAQSSLIVLAPCCHKQIRLQITPNKVLKDLLKFGILMERQSEIVTDGIRALLLEAFGYSTNVFEFISPEHTSKNVMIVGIKSDKPVDKEHILVQIKEIKKLYGIRIHYLETLLFPQSSLSSDMPDVKHRNGN
jgi:SAM-dependent methyltransferase